jgi:hypothetical protein
MKVESREYKLLIQHEPFVDPAAAVLAVWDEIKEAMRTLPGVETKGEFDEEETRKILFIDTPDHTLRRNSLILRQRSSEDAVEYTLKCRTEDRYFAAGTDVEAAKDRRTDGPKLEEDIAPPFLCRFSHSATITLNSDTKAKLRKTPETLGQAAALFPLLGTLRVDDRSCPPKTVLKVVNNVEVEETVWKGSKILIEQDDEESEKASLALIVWTRVTGHGPIVAELSFRIKDKEENYSRQVAQTARSVYRLLQRLDCALPDGMTKTEYVYRDSSLD